MKILPREVELRAAELHDRLCQDQRRFQRCDCTWREIIERYGREASYRMGFAGVQLQLPFDPPCRIEGTYRNDTREVFWRCTCGVVGPKIQTWSLDEESEVERRLIDTFSEHQKRS